MAIGKRKVHDFCWINLMTPEFDHAATFFQRLLGWSYADGITGGHVILVEGLSAGALMDLTCCPPGIPPVIGVMVKVENADATVARVQALGGSAEPAFDVMGNGRMASCTDPNGAIFNVWQPLSKDGAECDPLAPGAPTWFEMHTTDLERAASFYTDLFGWTAVTEEPAPGMTYTVFSLGGVPVAGAMRLRPEMLDKVPPHWGTYFTVRSADETVQRAKELDAEVCFGPHDIPNIGRFALLKSPQGVSFHVIQHQN